MKTFTFRIRGGVVISRLFNFSLKTPTPRPRARHLKKADFPYKVLVPDPDTPQRNKFSLEIIDNATEIWYCFI